ncbi:hypothetical protein ACI3L3_14115 [Desulfobaculum sp. SPO524]|uniref:hypothetical protein n=1 Tax=Desulfobaculum sp. SPO524 TaxID=3378071 RepID=UPI00385251E7
MAAGDRKQLTLRIPAETHKKLRILAAVYDTTMTEYFITLVDDAYERENRHKGPVQLKLPT